MQHQWLYSISHNALWSGLSAHVNLAHEDPDDMLVLMTHRAEQHIAFQWVGPTRVGDAYCQARVYAMRRHRYVGVHVVPEAQIGADCMLLQIFMQQCWQISAAAWPSGPHAFERSLAQC